MLPVKYKIANGNSSGGEYKKSTRRATCFPGNLATTNVFDKPRDKKTNYVKRCVGIAGDSLQIKDGIVFVNGKELILPERAKPQYSYKISTDGKTPIDFETILKEMQVTDPAGMITSDTLYVQALTFENAEKLKMWQEWYREQKKIFESVK